MLIRKDYIYLALAIVLSMVFVCGISVKQVYDEDVLASALYQELKGKEAEDALAILLAERANGSQNPSHQLTVAFKIGQNLQQQDRMIEATPYFEEVLQAKTGFLPRLLFGIEGTDSKGEAAFVLAEHAIQQEEYARALQLLEQIERKWLYPGCGTGSLEIQGRVYDMRIRCALATQNTALAMHFMQGEFFRPEQWQHRQLPAIIEHLKEQYSKEEIQAALSQLIADAYEINWQEQDEDLRYFEYRSTLLGQEVIILSEYDFYSLMTDGYYAYCRNRAVPLDGIACRMEFVQEYIRCSHVYQELSKTD